MDERRPTEGPDDGPLRLGTMLFTLVEPDGNFRAYNRWYERDHFYGGVMNLPYTLAGQRWMALRTLKALRYPNPSPIVPVPSDGSFLTTYYVLDGHHPEWDVASVEVVLQDLAPAGRMWPSRRHIITKLFDFQHASYRDPDPVPATLTLHHRYNGLVVVVGSLPSGDAASTARTALLDEVIPSLLAGSPVASVLTFTQRPFEGERPGDLVWSDDPPERFYQLWFVEADPRDVWDATFAPLGVAAIDASGHATIEWVGGFVPTVPGTDTHIDEL